MKRLLLFLILSFIAMHSFAKQVSVEKAKQIASIKLSEKQSLRSSNPELNLVYTAKNESNLRSNKPINFYYVFNIGDNQGFIIISADDINYPVIAYSDKGSFHVNNSSENFKAWMKSIELGMTKAFAENKRADEAIRQQWESPQTGISKLTIAEIPPLLKTEWGQSSPYNNLIPVNDGGKKVLAGSTAVALAQIMKYHNYPQKATDTISAYTTYPNMLNINEIILTNYSYDWSNMKDIYTNTNTDIQKNAVATLIYHCGASIKTNYSATYSTNYGSPYNALLKNFGYDKDIRHRQRNSISLNYPDSVWISLMKQEIDNQRPILYSGYSNDTTMHSFVCDGYDKNDLFHFNWGAEGVNDGYFSINAPLAYTRYQEMTFNIKPNQGGTGIPEFYVNSYKANAEIIHKGEKFKTDFHVWDHSIHYFTPNFELALYNSSGNFVSLINESLVNNYDKIHEIPTTVPAGVYSIRAVLKDSVQNIYTPIPNKFGMPLLNITLKDGTPRYNHFMTVMDNNEYDGYRNMTASATSGQAGDQFYVDLTLKNSGHETFDGEACLGLVNSSDSILYILADSINKSISLPPGMFYQSFYISGKITGSMSSGNYYIRLVTKQSNSNKWLISHGRVNVENYTVMDKLPFSIQSPVSVKEYDLEKTVVYYNKFLKAIIIESEDNSIENVSLYDFSGRKIIETENRSDKISMENELNGVYILRIKTNIGTTTHKIIKN